MISVSSQSQGCWDSCLLASNVLRTPDWMTYSLPVSPYRCLTAKYIILTQVITHFCKPDRSHEEPRAAFV